MHATAHSLDPAFPNVSPPVPPHPVPPHPAGRHPASVRRGVSVGAVLLAATAVLAACSSNSATPATSSTAGGSVSASTAGGSNTASTGSSALVVSQAARGSVGTVLVGSNGHTLYKLTTDTPTASTCTAACAQLWPPVTVPAGTTVRAATGLSGGIGTITRSDGTVQVTYLGHPLYTYAPDTTATDTLGQGVGGVWFVVSAPGASGAATTTTTAVRSGYGY